jgi:hypothetical protein
VLPRTPLPCRSRPRRCVSCARLPSPRAAIVHPLLRGRGRGEGGRRGKEVLRGPSPPCCVTRRAARPRSSSASSDTSRAQPAPARSSTSQALHSSQALAATRSSFPPSYPSPPPPSPCSAPYPPQCDAPAGDGEGRANGQPPLRRRARGLCAAGSRVRELLFLQRRRARCFFFLEAGERERERERGGRRPARQFCAASNGRHPSSSVVLFKYGHRGAGNTCRVQDSNGELNRQKTRRRDEQGRAGDAVVHNDQEERAAGSKQQRADAGTERT